MQITRPVFGFNALLHPARTRPSEGRPGRSFAPRFGEAGYFLASWASDASAIASCPALRAPEGLEAPVTIGEILEALCELGGGPRNPPGGKPSRRYSTSRVLAA